MTYDVFISYSRKDTAIADRVCAAFDAAGISYFIDRQGIAGGMEFPQILADAIENSRLFLFLASENSYNSKYTKNEVAFAFNEKSHNSLLPYIIDGSRMPSLLRFTFANINVRTMREHPIDPVLVDDVLKLLGRTRRAQAAPPQSPQHYTQEELGEMTHKGLQYFFGLGVPQDYGEAVRWYRKAAEQGNGDAQYNLAIMYKYGHGVNKDLSEARRWFQKAADQGDENAKEQLRKL